MRTFIHVSTQGKFPLFVKQWSLGKLKVWQRKIQGFLSVGILKDQFVNWEYSQTLAYHLQVLVFI